MKKLITIFLVVLFIFGIVGCINRDNTKNKIKITTSTQLLKEFTERIGGDKVSVESLLDDKSNINDYKISESDIHEISNSKLFIYNGAGLENYINKLNNLSKVILVDGSKGCNIIYDNKKPNPYYYLSPLEVVNQCKNILNSLIKIDKENKQYYEKNYNYFVEDLKAMYDTYKEKFNNKLDMHFVINSESFKYICRDFNLKNKIIENEDKKINYDEIVEFCNDYGIRVIFYCDSDTVSKNIAEKIGGEVKELYDYDNYVNGKNYIDVMNENLTSIYYSY